MSDLKFRNIDVDPSAPVEDWGFEGLLAAVDRGGFNDWRRVMAAVRRDPWGPVARILEDEVLEVAESSGVVNAMRISLRQIRETTAGAERQEVARELTQLLARSGLNRRAFAERMGTSASRLSTYLSGKVTPSAALLVRARRVAELSAKEK